MYIGICRAFIYRRVHGKNILEIHMIQKSSMEKIRSLHALALEMIQVICVYGEGTIISQGDEHNSIHVYCALWDSEETGYIAGRVNRGG